LFYNKNICIYEIHDKRSFDMPYRKVATRELAKLLGVLSNPYRIRILEELRAGELRVGEIQEKVELRPATVSQHLAVLRAHQVISERREGRNVYYHLNNPELAHWLADGLNFVIPEAKESRKVRSAIKAAKELWLGDEET